MTYAKANSRPCVLRQHGWIYLNRRIILRVALLMPTALLYKGYLRKPNPLLYILKTFLPFVLPLLLLSSPATHVLNNFSQKQKQNKPCRNTPTTQRKERHTRGESSTNKNTTHTHRHTGTHTHGGRKEGRKGNVFIRPLHLAMPPVQ